MASIEDQLTQLESDRDDLVSNLTTKGISGLTGDETFTELVPEVLNISTGGGVNINDYFADTLSAGTSNNSWINSRIKKVPDDLSCGASLQYAFSRMTHLAQLPRLDTSEVGNFSNMCQYCSNLKSIPELDTSSGSTFDNMFNYCNLLETVPVFDLENATSFSGMFGNCTHLSNNSLNNILASCISVTSTYTGTKTLSVVFNGNMSQYYPASTIESLSNYTAFTNAGWTIGWN